MGALEQGPALPQLDGLEHSPCRGSVRILTALLHGSVMVMPERGESIPSFVLLAALATQLQLLAVPVLPRIPELYRDGHSWPRAGHPTASWALLTPVFIHGYSYRRCPN